MGQSSSKSAGAVAHAAKQSMRLPRSNPAPATTQQPAGQQSQPSSMRTREQMLAEDSAEEASEDKPSENLKLFLNPRELRTPITPVNPGENVNVQALRSRNEADDLEMPGAKGRLTARQTVELLREYRSTGDARQTSAKYGVAEDVVVRLGRYLNPVSTQNAQHPGVAKEANSR
ncbi:hypothetical protein GGI07_004344 [Coemansia sp. Benny D115]|nr:hypothetical protein GGI07_004344 [Coemansia sp. Benny D115]